MTTFLTFNKTKKEITFNLLKERTCDNCVYHMPYSDAASFRPYEHCVKRVSKRMPIPKLRTCRKWTNNT